MAGDNRVLLQDGYILHRRPYRETSLILEIFTRDYGKIALLAKGARQLKSKQAALLQPFVRLKVSWSGRSELPILTGAEGVAPFVQLFGKPLYCGLYLNELLIHLLHRHDPHPPVFTLYENTLCALASGEHLERSLRLFEVNLLKEIGYGLLFDQADGSAVESGKMYAYIVDQGPVEAEGGKLHGSTLIGLRQGRLETETALREAKHLMRQIIDYHMAGRPLKCRSLFRYSKTL